MKKTTGRHAHPDEPISEKLLLNSTQPTVGQQLRLIKKDLGLFSVGALLGGFVPVAVFALSGFLTGPTHDITAAWSDSPSRNFTNCIIAILILAGCAFSAKSVYGWGQCAFVRDRWKALGFCILIEGVMVFSPLYWLHVTAGIFLLAINAIATGSNLIVEDDAFRKRESKTDNHHGLELIEPALKVEAKAIQPKRPKASPVLSKRPKTNREKRRMKAKRIINKSPEITNFELAQKIGVTEKTAAVYRKAIEGSIQGLKNGSDRGNP